MLADHVEMEERAEENKIGRRNWFNLVAYILNSAITYVSLTGVFGATNSDLSDKYQTLVTPKGWAFSIWGPIFIWEGVFAVAQMLPRFRGARAVTAITPWWLGACASQCLWTVFFAQEVIPMSLVCMLSILAFLLGLVFFTDGLRLTWAEYLCLRAPFSLHLGWIIAASAVNANVQVDASKGSPEVLLAFAVVSFVAVGVVNTILVTATANSDPIVSLVASWAFAGVAASLSDPVRLNSEARYNPLVWPPLVLDGLQKAAVGASLLALLLAAAGFSRVVFRSLQQGNNRSTSQRPNLDPSSA